MADVAKLNGYDEIVFYDDNTDITACDGYLVLGTCRDFAEAPGQLFVATGNSEVRKRIMKELANRNFPVLIHPRAAVAASARIDHGTVVMAGAVINADAVIGQGCIVNTGSSVDHDCVVGDFCHIAVGANLCGTVKVGRSTWIGAGAIVSNNVNICDGCTIGAGAVVIRDIVVPGKYVGVPARMMEEGRG